jgi:hypothetical protein
MARPEVTGKKLNIADGKLKDNEPPPPPPRMALSIREFCYSHNISEDFYFKLKRQGKGPVEMKVGTRTLISIEAAADWRRAREAIRTVDERGAAKAEAETA